MVPGREGYTKILGPSGADGFRGLLLIIALAPYRSTNVGIWGTFSHGSGCFVDRALAPVYAYAPIGERAFFEAPRNRGRSTTLIASLHSEGMGPSMAVEGATTGEVFEVYVEHFLGPALRFGQIVVMDNLGAHRPQRVRKLIEQRGCELLSLPPYCPDLNPIEEAFSKVKNILRKLAARTKETLVEAMAGH